MYKTRVAGMKGRQSGTRCRKEHVQNTIQLAVTTESALPLNAAIAGACCSSSRTLDNRHGAWHKAVLLGNPFF